MGRNSGLEKGKVRPIRVLGCWIIVLTICGSFIAGMSRVKVIAALTQAEAGAARPVTSKEVADSALAVFVSGAIDLEDRL